MGNVTIGRGATAASGSPGNTAAKRMTPAARWMHCVGREPARQADWAPVRIGLQKPRARRAPLRPGLAAAGPGGGTDAPGSVGDDRPQKRFGWGPLSTQEPPAEATHETGPRERKTEVVRMTYQAYLFVFFSGKFELMSKKLKQYIASES